LRVSLAVTGALLEGEAVGLRVEEGLIAELGPGVESRDDDEMLDAGGAPLIPGLVNGHTHAAMTLFRGYGDDLPLMQWLQEKIWPLEAKLEPDDDGLCHIFGGHEPNTGKPAAADAVELALHHTREADHRLNAAALELRGQQLRESEQE